MQPVSVQPSLLLRQVIYNFMKNMSFEGFVGMIISTNIQNGFRF
jgi:hypothetical protein